MPAPRKFYWERDVERLVAELDHLLATSPHSETRDRLGTIFTNFNVVTDMETPLGVAQRIRQQDRW
jgi:hypothetical protein